MQTYPLPKVYQVEDGSCETIQEPVYILKDGFFCRTVNNPLGWSEVPDYELRGDGKVYRTAHHPAGMGEEPEFEFRSDGRLYATEKSVAGIGQQAMYEVRE